MLFDSLPSPPPLVIACCVGIPRTTNSVEAAAAAAAAAAADANSLRTQILKRNEQKYENERANETVPPLASCGVVMTNAPSMPACFRY